MGVVVMLPLRLLRVAAIAGQYTRVDCHDCPG